MACGGGCGCEACGDERRGRGVVLAAPFGTEASCGCDGGASATARTGARRPPRHPALAGVTAEEPVGVGAPARGGVRAGVVPPQALEQRPDPETLRFPVLPGTPESAPTPTPPAPGVMDALGTPPPVAPSQGVDVPAAPGVRERAGLAAPRMHFEEPTSQKRGKGGSGEPQARQPDDGELRVGDPAQLERPAPWDVVVIPPLGPWGSGPLLAGSAPRRRGPGAKIALGVAQRAPRPPEIHATLLPWGTLSTTPSMPTTASGDAKAAEPCPCTCACVPAEVAPSTSTTRVNAPGALLPGGGAAGTGGASPGAILVSHDDELEAAARLASIGIAGAPQRRSPPPEGDVDSTTSPGAGTTPPDPAASAQDAAEAAREAEALAHEAARETAAADTVEGKLRGAAQAAAAADGAKQAAKDARDRAAGAPSDRKASADRAARDAGKAAARAEKAADAAKKDALRAVVASGGGGKGKGLSQDGTEEVLPARTPPVSSPSDVARRPSPPPLSPPLHPSGGVGGLTRVAVPDGALPAVRGFGAGSGTTVALGVASPPREAAPFGAGGRIDGTEAPWVAPASSALGPGGARRRRERATVAASPPNSAPTVPLPDRVGWMLGEVGGGERDAGRELDKTPFGAEGSTQRPVGGLVSRTKDATTPSAPTVAPPQVPDAPAGPVRAPAGAASSRDTGAGAGSGVAAVVPPQGAPRSAGPLRGSSFAPAAVAPGTAALGPADGGVAAVGAADFAPEVPSRPPRTPPGSGAQPGVALRSAALDVPDGTERGAGGRGAVEDAVDARLAAGALASEAARARAAADAAREEADAARVTSDADLATYLRLVAKGRQGHLSDAEAADLKRAADSMKVRENTLDPLEKAAAEGEARADALDSASASARAAADDLATRAGAGNSQAADRIADGVRRRIDGAGGEAEVRLLELRDDRRISSKAGNLRGEVGALETARAREAAVHLARGAALDREDARQAALRKKAATSNLGPTERRDLARLERREDRRDAEREHTLDREIGLAGKLLGKLRTLRGKLEDAGKDTSEVDAKIKETEDSLGRLGRARDDLRDRRSRRAKAKAKGRTPEPSAMPMAWVTEQASVASSVSAAIGDTFSASAYAQVLAPDGSLFSSSAVLSAHGYDFDVGRGVLDASIGFAPTTVSAAEVVAPPQFVSLVGGPCPPGCCSTACKPGEVCRCIATTDPVTPDGTDPSSKTGEPLTRPPTPPTPPTPGGQRGGATGGAGGGGVTTQPPPGTVAPEHTYAPPDQPPPPDDTTTLAPPGSCPPGTHLCGDSGTVAPPRPPRPPPPCDRALAQIEAGIATLSKLGAELDAIVDRARQHWKDSEATYLRLDAARNMSLAGKRVRGGTVPGFARQRTAPSYIPPTEFRRSTLEFALERTIPMRVVRPTQALLLRVSWYAATLLRRARSGDCPDGQLLGFLDAGVRRAQAAVDLADAYVNHEIHTHLYLMHGYWPNVTEVIRDIADLIDAVLSALDELLREDAGYAGEWDLDLDRLAARARQLRAHADHFLHVALADELAWEDEQVRGMFGEVERVVLREGNTGALGLVLSALAELLRRAARRAVARAIPRLTERSVAAALIRRDLDAALRSRLITRRTPNDWTPGEARSRVQELKAQGHGPQRHEGEVRSAQHDARVLRGTDPATGRPELHVLGRKAGQPKKPPDSSSSFRSNEAYAQAEAAARSSPEFAAQELAGKKTIYVERLRLDDAIGSDYLRQVEGRTTTGVTKPGTTRAAEFRDGTIFAKYQWNAGTRRYDLVTMYPKGR